MQSSRSITSQFEELIKKAKLFSRLHKVVPDDLEVPENNSSGPVGLETAMLEKRHEMCVLQKNTIKDLIRLHNEEIQLLESALRTIESEERRILEIIVRERQEEDPLTRVTSVELVEHDNDSSKVGSHILSLEPVATDSAGGPENEVSRGFDESYVSQFGQVIDGYSKTDQESEDYNDSSDSSARENAPRKQDASMGGALGRRVRFSLEELGVASDKDSKRSSSKSNSAASDYSISRHSNSARTAISIPQRLNYMRNRDSSLMKEISIRKILDGNRKLIAEERTQDQKAMIRKLHSIYAKR